MLDSSRDCLGRWRFRLPAPSSNRLWRFGKARRPTCCRHSKLCIIEPSVIVLRAGGSTPPRWKGPEHDNKYPVTHETRGIAKTRLTVNVAKEKEDEKVANCFNG